MGKKGEAREYKSFFENAKENPNDTWFTPDYAIEYVYPLIAPYKRVWEPCCGKGHIVDYLRDRGHEVIATDILHGEEYDFYTYAPPPDAYDIIVTNPPYKGKRKILERLYELKKPFASLMPTLLLDSNPARLVLKDDPTWAILMPPRTIDFIPGTHEHLKKPPKGSRSFFHSSWYCHDIPTVRGAIFL